MTRRQAEREQLLRDLKAANATLLADCNALAIRVGELEQRVQRLEDPEAHRRLPV